MRSWFLFVLSVTFFAVPLVRAEEAVRIVHTPPPATEDREVVLSVATKGLTRARALILRNDGIEPVAMTRGQDAFTARIPFGTGASIRYMIQAQSEVGELVTTEEFVVARPAPNGIADGGALNLDKELAIADAKVRQLENAIFSLKNADPEDLRKRKSRELAKSLVTLSQKERDLTTAREEGRKLVNSFIKRRGLSVAVADQASAAQFMNDAWPKISGEK